jgi:hypothetical protein
LHQQNKKHMNKILQLVKSNLFAIPVNGDDIINRQPTFKSTIPNERMDFNSIFANINKQLR